MEFYCEGTKLPLDPDYAYVGCGWGYTWGLNPRNPRSAHNERERPGWLGNRDFGDWYTARTG